MLDDAEKLAFLKALELDRYDRTTRLVFADWLEEKGYDDEAVEQRRCSTEEWEEADRWMVNFADKCGKTCTNWPDTDQWEDDDTPQSDWKPITRDMVVEIGLRYLDSGGEDYFVQYGSEGARGAFREEFWQHLAVLTGIPVNPPDGFIGHSNPFSCSC